MKGEYRQNTKIKNKIKHKIVLYTKFSHQNTGHLIIIPRKPIYNNYTPSNELKTLKQMFNREITFKEGEH